MTGSSSDAFTMVFWISVCAVTAFVALHWIMSAWFEHKLRGMEAILLLCGLLGLMAVAISLVVRGEPGAVLMIVVVAGVGLFGRAMEGRTNRKLADGLDREEIAKYHAALAVDPNNVAAHSFLGDTYRRLGDCERAIEEYEAALRLDPSLKEERVWLERSRLELERRQRKDLRCPRCGLPRPPQASACPECGRLYSTVEKWGHAFRVMEPRSRAAWIFLAAGVTVGVIAAVLAAPLVAVCLAVIAAVLAPVALIVISLRARRTTG